MKRCKGFTLIELLVVISIIALLIGILLPALGSARRSAMQMKSNTQMRGMHQGMVIFAQDNEGFYPGMEHGGTRWTYKDHNLSGKYGATVEARFALMIERGHFAPDFAIHPAEPDFKLTHEPYDLGSGDTFTVKHYSYAMLQITINPPTWVKVNENETRYMRQEWKDTMNPKAIVLSDRLVGVKNWQWEKTENYQNVWTQKTGEARWGVAWNDNHVTFESTPLFETRYDEITNSSDDLYSRSLRSYGNIQSPRAPGINNGGNAFMISRGVVSLLQR